MNKEYKSHVYNLVMNVEKQRLSEDIDAVEREKEIAELMKKKREIAKQRKILNVYIKNITERIDYLRVRPTSKKEKGDIRVIPCGTSNCKGLLDSSFNCGLCKSSFCKKCHKPAHEEDCDPNEVESVREIVKNSKPCPSCGTRISKVSGCSQMWCIFCQTTFSWETGKVVTGVIHNPHYFEQLRTRGVVVRNPGDIPCGGIDFENFFHHDYTSELTGKRMKMYKFVSYIERECNHISQVYFQQLADYNAEDEKRKLRKRFLKNEITEKIWLSRLATIYKTIEKNIYIRQILSTFIDVIFDLVRRMEDLDYTSTETLNENEKFIIDTMKEIFSTIEYFNEQLIDYSKLFGVKTPVISVGEIESVEGYDINFTNGGTEYSIGANATYIEAGFEWYNFEIVV